MKQFLTQLSQRERQLLIVGGLLILAVMFWLLLYRPVTSYIEQRANLKIQLQQQLVSMQQAATGISHQQTTSKQSLPADKTFSAWLDGQLNQLNMQQSVKRSEPIDETTVSLWLESVPFDQWADWLQRINNQYGVVVDQVDINVTDRSLGLVTLRMRITKS
jgi:general secretion pathway protein M